MILECNKSARDTRAFELSRIGTIRSHSDMKTRAWQTPTLSASEQHYNIAKEVL
jgi:hypothetical protein